MSFDIPIEFGAVKLVAMICRIGAFVLAMPFINTEVVSLRYRILLSVAIAIVMLPVLGDAWSLSGSNSYFAQMDVLKMTLLIASEAMLGVAVALCFQAFVDIFSYAGTVMDMDVGFSASSEYDPTGETRTLLSHVLSQLFIVAFLVSDMHLEIFKIIALSFQTLPPGSFVVDGSLVEFFIRAVSSIFLVGIQLALPIMAAMFMINLGMAVLARIGEDFPVMMLSFALHLGVGILIFGAMLPSIMEFCRSYGLKLLESMLFIIAER